MAQLPVLLVEKCRVDLITGANDKFERECVATGTEQ